MSPPPVRALAFTSTALLTFFVLGVPDGLLGVAWPHMRIAHHEPASALSVLIVCGTGAFFISSLASGRITRYLAPTRLLVVAASVAGVGAFAVGTSPGFPTVALGVALLGVGGGLLDPLLSNIASSGADTRLVSLMHGVYAVGAAGAPLTIAAWATPSAWRFSYLAVAAGYVLALVGWLAVATRRRLPAPGTDNRAGTTTTNVSARGVFLTLTAFVAVSGLEISAAAWAAVYLTDALGQRSAVASLSLLGYWGALSSVRIGAGLVGGRPRAWLAGGCTAAVIGGVALWATPSIPVAVGGLVLLGGGTGPLLPILTAGTPQRVGPSASARVIGWQLAAASVGAAVVSAGIGLWVRQDGVWTVAPALALTALATAMVVAGVEAESGRRLG